MIMQRQRYIDINKKQFTRKSDSFYLNNFAVVKFKILFNHKKKDKKNKQPAVSHATYKAKPRTLKLTKKKKKTQEKKLTF